MPSQAEGARRRGCRAASTIGMTAAASRAASQAMGSILGVLYRRRRRCSYCACAGPSGEAPGRPPSKQTIGRASPSASWPAIRQRAIGSEGDARAWQLVGLQLPAVGMGTVTGCAWVEGDRGPPLASTPGAKWIAGFSGLEVAAPCSLTWMTWQAAQVERAAREGGGAPAPHSWRPPWQLTQAAVAGAPCDCRAPCRCGSPEQVTPAREVGACVGVHGRAGAAGRGEGDCGEEEASAAGRRRREDAAEAGDVRGGIGVGRGPAARARWPGMAARAPARVGEAGGVEGRGLVGGHPRRRDCSRGRRAGLSPAPRAALRARLQGSLASPPGQEGPLAGGWGRARPAAPRSWR